MFRISEKSFPHIWGIPVREKENSESWQFCKISQAWFTDIVSHPPASTILMSGKDFTPDTKKIPLTWKQLPYLPVYNVRPCIIRTLVFYYFFLKIKKIHDQNQRFNLHNFFIDLFVTRTWNSPRHLQQYKLTICFFTAVIAHNTFFKNLDVTYYYLCFLFNKMLL